ncbi:hypothetical protein [Parvibaculum sp.]|uniref:hypothetical protein n=1 Tax=Parvibaculum sp. TaxID=2024848 RepID=UPI001E00547A|nr:hypothetical protein [Parvibaculum sp.]MBX3487848.1 hypothetical protein [Parvibaculum sp.]
MAARCRKKTRRRGCAGLKANGRLKKGFRFAKGGGGRVVKAKAARKTTRRRKRSRR